MPKNTSSTHGQVSVLITLGKGITCANCRLDSNYVVMRDGHYICKGCAA